MAEDKTGLYLVTIVSIAVIVGLVTLYLNSGMALSLGDTNMAGQATMVEYGGGDKISISEEISISKDISASKEEVAIPKAESSISKEIAIPKSQYVDPSGIVIPNI